MVKTAILPTTNQTVYLVYIPINNIFGSTKWFCETGVEYGKDYGWWAWRCQSDHFSSLFRVGFALCWIADPQAALMFSLRWC